jgi:hypothetical protein
MLFRLMECIYVVPALIRVVVLWVRPEETPHKQF